MSDTPISRMIGLSFAAVCGAAIIGAVIALGASIYSDRATALLIDELRPAQTDLALASYETTKAHLVFEEIMGGDASEDVAEVYALIDDASAAVRTLRDSAAASATEGLTARLYAVLEQLAGFREATAIRHATLGGTDEALAGSEIEAAFDETYDGIMRGLESAMADIDKAVEVGHSIRARASWLLFGALGGGAALIVGAALASLSAVRRRVSEPLSALAAATTRLAQGHLDARHHLASGCVIEATVMADALEAFRRNAVSVADAAKSERGRAAEAEVLRAGIARVIAAASEGQFGQRVAVTLNDAELQALADAVTVLMANLDQAIGEVAQALRALAEGDLAFSPPAGRRGALVALTADVAATATSLTEVIGCIADAAADIEASSDQIASTARDVSGRAEGQAAALEETAATMEQMSLTVRANAERAERALKLARAANASAGRGNAVVTDAADTMRGIEESSKRIAEIIGVIDSIAFTTNLLALNASVEAARAGEAGKGFAVVASEVRSLAQRSADAASEIRELIRSSVDQVAEGAERVEGSRAALAEIAAQVESVASAITEIAEAGREQAAGVEEVSSSLGQIDQITQANAALAEESATSAAELQAQAGRLRSAVARFRLPARHSHETLAAG